MIKFNDIIKMIPTILTTIAIMIAVQNSDKVKPLISWLFDKLIVMLIKKFRYNFIENIKQSIFIFDCLFVLCDILGFWALIKSINRGVWGFAICSIWLDFFEFIFENLKKDDKKTVSITFNIFRLVCSIFFMNQTAIFSNSFKIFCMLYMDKIVNKIKSAMIKSVFCSLLGNIEISEETLENSLVDHFHKIQNTFIHSNISSTLKNICEVVMTSVLNVESLYSQFKGDIDNKLGKLNNLRLTILIFSCLFLETFDKFLILGIIIKIAMIHFRLNPISRIINNSGEQLNHKILAVKKVCLCTRMLSFCF